MTHTEWNPSFETGVPLLDKGNQHIIEKLNAVQKAFLIDDNLIEAKRHLSLLIDAVARQRGQAARHVGARSPWFADTVRATYSFMAQELERTRRHLSQGTYTYINDFLLEESRFLVVHAIGILAARVRGTPQARESEAGIAK